MRKADGGPVGEVSIDADGTPAGAVSTEMGVTGLVGSSAGVAGAVVSSVGMAPVGHPAAWTNCSKEMPGVTAGAVVGAGGGAVS